MGLLKRCSSKEYWSFRRKTVRGVFVFFRGKQRQTATEEKSWMRIRNHGDDKFKFFLILIYMDIVPLILQPKTKIIWYEKWWRMLFQKYMLIIQLPLYVSMQEPEGKRFVKPYLWPVGWIFWGVSTIGFSSSVQRSLRKTYGNGSWNEWLLTFRYTV